MATWSVGDLKPGQQLYVYDKDRHAKVDNAVAVDTDAGWVDYLFHNQLIRIFGHYEAHILEKDSAPPHAVGPDKTFVRKGRY